MPDQQKHLAQAQHNEELYHHLADATPRFIDWQITALFYAALHYVDAYLAKFAIHPNSHEERSTWMGRESVLKTIYAVYRDLQNRSRDARYEIYPMRAGDEHTLYTTHFTAIRDHLMPRM
jgi:hypothetical protein